MSEVVEVRTQLPTQFEPSASHDKQAQADAVIQYAKRVKDWPLLEQAIDSKIEEQAEFVTWWESNVKHGKVKITDHVISSEEAEHLTGFAPMRVSRMRKRLSDIEAYRQQLYGAAWKKAFPDVADEAHQATGTGDNEWYTPQKYIDAAREVMGGIDLDPATSELAQQRIQAEHYYTEGALDRGCKWHGRVWLNPPYSKELIGPFIDKLAESFGSGSVTEAILLTHNYTDTAWFHAAESCASAICLTRGRVAFESPTGEKAAPTQGQAFSYFGDNPDVFGGVFTEFGFVR